MAGGKTSAQWAAYNISEFYRCRDTWEKSLQHARPDYNALLGIYKHLYGAEINFLDAGMKSQAKEAGRLRKKTSHVLEKMMSSSGAIRATAIWQSAQ